MSDINQLPFHLDVREIRWMVLIENQDDPEAYLSMIKDNIRRDFLNAANYRGWYDLTMTFEILQNKTTDDDIVEIVSRVWCYKMRIPGEYPNSTERV